MPFINLGSEKQAETKEKNVTEETVPAGWRVEVEKTTYTSGWMGDRIDHWKRGVDRRCQEAEWLWPSLERHF